MVATESTNSQLETRTGAVPAAASQACGLASLAYRSRAVVPMSESELRTLQESSQVRNRASGITGLVTYDDGFFLQCIEGPSDSVARLWDAVRRDPRHTDIEILVRQPTASRFFADWDLVLSSRAALLGDPKALPSGALEGPFAVLSFFESLAVAARSFAPTHDGRARAEARPAGGTPASGAVSVHDGSALRGLLEAVVIPRLIGSRHAARNVSGATHPRVAELARLVLDADGTSGAALVQELYAVDGELTPLCARIFEPVARLLGDRFLSDDCSQVEVTLGLCRLQSYVRQISADAHPAALGLPVVLVAAQPGEVHLLGAALDAEVLWRAGWDTHHELPDTDEDLEAMLAGEWFDALDLSLSAALLREDWIPRMGRTIGRARSASKNPGLTIVVGGRVFVEQCDASTRVGADASCPTSTHVGAVLSEMLRATPSRLRVAG